MRKNRNMRKTIFILIYYLCCIGCTSQKTTLSQYKEEIITKIPNESSLKGRVKHYKESNYAPIWERLSPQDSTFSRWSEMPYFVIEYFLDPKGNILKEYRQIKEPSDSLYDISENQYLYDEKGKLIQKISKEGYFSKIKDNEYKYIYYTNYIYDDKNRLIEEEKCSEDLLDGEKMIYTYDNHNNIIEKISFNDENNHFYREIYDYNTENRKTNYRKEYIINGYKDKIKENIWKYNKSGNIDEEYVYELSSTQYEEGTLIYNNAIRYYKYNDKGKLIEIRDKYLSSDSIIAQGATEGHTSYVYNSKGNLLSKAGFIDGRLSWSECYDECQYLVGEVYVSQEGEIYNRQHYYQQDSHHNPIERVIISDFPIELYRYEIEYYK